MLPTTAPSTTHTDTRTESPSPSPSPSRSQAQSRTRGDATHGHPSTSCLLSAARAGDELAWRELVARYRPLLTGVTRRHGLPADEAADVIQETWVRLLQQLPAVRDAERLPGWLATTARRECIARRRRTWRESPTWDGSWPEAADDAADPGDRLVASDRAAALHTAVRALPARERALVEVLLEAEPPTYLEIQRRLGMPVGSIGPVRARALRRLREALAGDAEPQPLTA